MHPVMASCRLSVTKRHFVDDDFTDCICVNSDESLATEEYDHGPFDYITLFHLTGQQSHKLTIQNTIQSNTKKEKEDNSQ